MKKLFLKVDVPLDLEVIGFCLQISVVDEENRIRDYIVRGKDVKLTIERGTQGGEQL